VIFIPHFYSHREEGESLIIFLPGKVEPFVALGDHPNFAKLRDAAAIGDLDEVYRLRDIAESIAHEFMRLGDRVTARDRRIYFDGDEVDNRLTAHILKFMDEGEDFAPLVNFFEKIAFNPSAHSREQLYDWIDSHDLTIMPDGRFVAYKGVYSNDTGGYRSGRRGHGFVNDVEFVNAYLPYAVGDDVRMPRAEVEDDPAQSCRPGLHAGTYSYAKTYSSRGVMMRVAIDPADVGSVPRDGNGEKIRVCRFTIEEIINEPTTGLVYRDMVVTLDPIDEGDSLGATERQPNTAEPNDDVSHSEDSDDWRDGRIKITPENVRTGMWITALPTSGSYYIVERVVDNEVLAHFRSPGTPDYDYEHKLILDNRPGGYVLHESSPIGIPNPSIPNPNVASFDVYADLDLGSEPICSDCGCHIGYCVCSR
jgi:hypothetical protein